MTASELKKIADELNLNREAFIKKESETTIQFIKEGLTRSAKQGKYQRTEYVKKEEIPIVGEYLKHLQTLGFKVTYSYTDTEVAVLVSWSNA